MNWHPLVRRWTTRLLMLGPMLAGAKAGGALARACQAAARLLPALAHAFFRTMGPLA